ncbi:MAG TPA: M14 family zinc carboxypeptidase [Chitinophagales bacterium]|nr:M14 family zinc carboxypeptidase [Chitinophagales bacterium]
MKKIFLLLFLLTAPNITFSQAIYQRIYFEASPEQIQSLITKGVALDHLLRQQDGYVAELSKEEVLTMTNAGVKVEIIITDLSADFKSKYSSFKEFSNLRDFTPPAHFHAGSMGGALTYSELVNELDSMKLYFPDIITAKASLGDSYEGRPVYMVKISDNPDSDEDEPEVEFDALHHAREPVSMMHLIYYMWWLLENYNVDSLATYLVNEREIYFVPVVNPDGYYYNESTNPGGGGYWRKNRRDNGNGTYGIDLNRNYSFGWGLDSGSSGDSNSDVYRGTAPFSEPETAVMRDFFTAHEFVTTVSCHTSGNYFIHPWGYTNDDCADVDWFSAYSERATRWSDYFYGNCYQTLNYFASGTTIDFNYGEQILKPRSMAFTPETGYSFWPDPNDIPEMCAKIIEQNILCTYLPNAIFTISASDQSTASTSNVEIPFSVYNVGLQQGNVHCYLQSSSPYVIDDGDTVTVSSVAVLANAASSLEIQLDGATPNQSVIEALLIADDGLIKDSVYINIEFSGFPTQVMPLNVSLKLLPNPAGDYVQLEGTWHEASISFFDMTGKELHTLHPLPNTVIDISLLPQGLYYLEIKTDDGDFRVKLVKE